MSTAPTTADAVGRSDRLCAEDPLWFGPVERPLFGWVHYPPDRQAIGGVVLCPPLAREWVNAHYCYRVLAETAAQAGFFVLRFDYDGTGDSAGTDHDPDRVKAWLTSIEAAVGLARDAGCRSVSLVGMRMGALLAALSASRLGGLESVVLWDPCSSTRSFLREQAALARLAGVTDHPEQGPGELPGMVLSPQTASDLLTLEVPPPTVPPQRVLLLTRPGRSPQVGLAETLGAEVTHGAAIGQEQLLEVDLADRTVPNQTVAEVVSWLTEAAGSPSAVIIPRREAVRLRSGGTELCERTIRIGAAGLFGIVSEPLGPSVSTTVLMLNSGNNSHVGPSRLWVELSRRWAAMGVRCVRFDQSGLGDSPTRPGQAPQVIRAPENFDDVADARAELASDPRDVVLVGLCSGAYQALEAALAEPVRAVYAINPILHFTPPELADGPMDPRRRICWPVGSVVSAYRLLAAEPLRRRLGKVAWRLAHLLHRRRSPVGWLGALERAGTQVLIMCGSDEARSFGVEAYTSLVSGSGRPVQVEVVEGLDHALVPARQRSAVARRLTEHLAHLLAADALPAAADLNGPGGGR